MPTSTVQRELTKGWQLHQAKRWKEAEAVYRSVLERRPTDANAWCYLGMVLHDRQQYSAAVEAYHSALRHQPKFPIALNNLGNSLRYLHQFEEADSCFQQAIDLSPDYLNAYKNRGTLHVWSGRLESGKAYYQQALAINPQEAELHRNLGVIHLLQGNFPEGWREYRWRWKVGDLHRPAITAPVWTGEDLSGKSILLSAEQGLGDTLNFVRLARELRDRGARPTIYCQPQLMALLQNSPELGRIYPNSLAVDQDYDFQCSLLDIADQLQLDTHTIPRDVPYLSASPHLVRYWEERLSKTAGTFHVGIAWQGNPEHQADAFRSIPLKAFEPLAEVPGVEFISLQVGRGEEQIASWSGRRPVHTLGENLDRSSGAFMDTAAIIRLMDLVITSDTAIAHLAGALAVPTWIALGKIPDWRWLLDRADSPWYPTARLFRQRDFGDWDTVFEEMRRELLAHVAAPAR